jgi:hypothetical protein
LFSEQNVEKYAGSSDESCLSGTELDNFVSRGEKGGAQFFHLAVNLVGKRARSTGEQVKMSKPLCMRNWLLQIQEMEKALVQGN